MYPSMRVVIALCVCLNTPQIVISRTLDHVDSLIQQLRNPDPVMRVRAVGELSILGDLRAVEPLIETLRNDKDDLVRLCAAKEMWRLGDHRAVEPLIAALNDENNEVQVNAMASLGELKDPGAIGPIVAQLKSSQWQNR